MSEFDPRFILATSVSAFLTDKVNDSLAHQPTVA